MRTILSYNRSEIKGALPMTLCEIKRKDIVREIDRIQRMVTEPEYICSKCLRSAAKKKFLCKPSALEHLGSEA
jgi:hypothetical protein